MKILYFIIFVSLYLQHIVSFPYLRDLSVPTNTSTTNPPITSTTKPTNTSTTNPTTNPTNIRHQVPMMYGMPTSGFYALMIFVGIIVLFICCLCCCGVAACKI